LGKILLLNLDVSYVLEQMELSREMKWEGTCFICVTLMLTFLQGRCFKQTRGKNGWEIKLFSQRTI